METPYLDPDWTMFYTCTCQYIRATKSGTGPRDYDEDVNFDMQPDYSNLHTYPTIWDMQMIQYQGERAVNLVLLDTPWGRG